MSRFGFGAASADEQVVYGSQRPGYRHQRPVADPVVDEWLAFMRTWHIRRICCLLSPTQLGHYGSDLLAEYARFFGQGRVLHAPVEDYYLAAEGTLLEKILPFLDSANGAGERALVHCSGGSGRTGHVLAAWLVHARAFAPEDALTTVRETGRNPTEAVEFGNATWDELIALLSAAAAHR